MRVFEEAVTTSGTVYAPASTRACLSVFVREIRDVAVGLFPRRLFVRVWLDTSFPLQMNEETEFATNVVTFRRRNRGPQRFVLEGGQSNRFSLPDYVVVCDVCEVRRGFFCGETYQLVSRVRIPLARTKFDPSGWSELWYSFHYSLKDRRARAGRFAGRILVALHYESNDDRENGSTGATVSGAGTMTPGALPAFSGETTAAWIVPETRKWTPVNTVPEYQTKMSTFGEKPEDTKFLWNPSSQRNSNVAARTPVVSNSSGGRPVPVLGI
jgi:hypothetical protein